ncbi:ubiquitin carboxyl-terminal hydrolase 23-like isoform X2 [Triticum urartu]|nr:ubiquitin carboxyl-terminal hydrolase 23-like isoform X2 [Triticum urartu]
MVNLLESMHKCCLPSGVPSESASAYEKSLVHRIFGGRLRSQVKCTRCSHCSNTFDPFLDLSLDIGKATTLVRALQNFTEDELLDGGQKQYQCERCRQKVVAKKRFTIDQAPNVLTVHLKRFSPFRPREKIDKKVDFQPVLDLKPFMSDSKGADYKYSLYGVLVHAGWSTQSGHYYCFVRTSSGMWHNLDDNQVRQVREADVLKQKAYMLFYVRDRIGNTLGRKDNSTPNLPVNNMIPGKISSINGVMEAKSSGLTSPYANKKLQSTSNAHSSVSSMTLVDHCSTNAGKAETAAALQNSVLPAAQKALGPQNDGATLSTKSKQVASSSHKETSSSDQLASSNQTMAKMSLQEPKTGGALAKLGNNTSIASSMVSGPAGLSETDKQTSCSQTCSKPSSNLVGTITGFTAQTFQTKDAVLSNGVIPSTSGGDPVSSEKMKDLTGSLKQDDHIVKALTTSKKEKTILPGLEQVDVGKQISSQVSTKVVPGDSCNGRMTKRVDSKSKKLVRYPLMKLWLRPRQLSLKQQKKKHKKTKKRVKDTASVDCSGDNSSEQQTSTSATVPPKTAGSTSRKRKHAHASASSENGTQVFKDSQQVVGASSAGAGDHNMDARNGKSQTSANQANSRNNVDAKRGAASQQVVIRTEDLRAEVTVPCWDDVAVPNSETSEYKSSGKKSIGYVLDEWDEEYDRGKAKKVRKAKEDDDDNGMNPFQAEANYVSARKTKQNSYKSKPWDKPARPSR